MGNYVNVASMTNKGKRLNSACFSDNIPDSEKPFSCERKFNPSSGHNRLKKMETGGLIEQEGLKRKIADSSWNLNMEQEVV